jgi:hypothetical protein
MNAERPDERRHAPFHVDDGRTSAQGFGIQVHEHKPGFLAMGER